MEERARQREEQKKERELLKERLREEKRIKREEGREKRRLLKEKLKEKKPEKPIAIQKGHIKLVFEVPSFTFYYKGKLISKNNFLDTSYIYGGRERKTEFEGLKIKILKRSECTLKILLYKWNIPIQQIWTVSLEKRDYIDWKGELLVKDKNLPISNKQIILNINRFSSDCFTEYESGRFDKLTSEKHMATVRFTKPNAHIIGIKPGDAKILPSIALLCQDKKDYIVDCFTSKNQSTLKALEINRSKTIKHKKGKHEFFKVKICVSSKKIQEALLYHRKAKDKSVVLKNNYIELKFSKGGARLYLKGKELTTGLGLYSSIFSKQKWMDSSQASWKIVRKRKSDCIISGSWAWIPLFQRWHFQLDEKGNILWDISTDTYDKTKIDLEQINVMLGMDYVKWRVPAIAEGVFPKDFENIDIDNYWERLYYGTAKNSLIESESSNNKILYRPVNAGKNLKLVIENSDSFYKGRVLQCRKMGMRSKKPVRTMITVTEVKNE